MTEMKRLQQRKKGSRDSPAAQHEHHQPTGQSGWAVPEPVKKYCVTILVFLISFFFIITISTPALFMNDEWISANQLHQLDSGHQITYNEGKYGVTENGTVSAYFTTRNNVLMYPLALPLIALPIVKIFTVFSDNFRMFVILIWSLIPILVAFIIDTCLPEHSRIGRIRILFPAILFGLGLFLINTLLYKQFPFTAPDAPFEVAALVLANQILFALLAAVLYETSHLVFDNISLSLFSTFCCISCSSFIFWAGTAKDHILTATVLACIILFFMRFLFSSKYVNVFYACVGCGLLIWIRPELGFFITIATVLFYCSVAIGARNKTATLRENVFQWMPLSGIIIGAMPFFVNNLVVNRNLLIPVFDRGAGLTNVSYIVQGPAPLTEVLTSSVPSAETATGFLFLESFPRVLSILFSRLFSGFSFNNLAQIPSVLFLPENNNFGFLIICPLIVFAAIATVLWYNEIRSRISRIQGINAIFLIVLLIAIFFAYLPNMGTLSASRASMPDMRYLSPAYIPAGLLSLILLNSAGLIGKGKKMTISAFKFTVIGVPLLLFLMIVLHPFGSQYTGYSEFYKICIVGEIVLTCILLIALRITPPTNAGTLQKNILRILVITVVTVFAFQFMLTFIASVVTKFNGYPFWIPLVREGYKLVFQVTYLSPI
jgi:hypothetical protein